MELFSLAGKNAVVVGGAGGLGQAIAQGLAEAGARVAIASRKEESLRRAVEEIKTACGKWTPPTRRASRRWWPRR